MSSLLTEIRLTLRVQSKKPRLAVAAVLTLGLGIGATTAIFAVVNALLIKSLPYRDSSTLVILQESGPEGTFPPSYATFLDWTETSKSFSEMACYRPGTAIVLGEYADRFTCKWVSANLFSTLGIAFVEGRPFVPDEDSLGGRPVVIVTESFADKHLGSRKGRVGRSINVEGTSREIVGVIASGFRLSGDADLLLPIHPRAAGEPREQRDALYVAARLRPRISLQAAASEMQLIARRLQIAHPKGAAPTVAVIPLRDWVASATRRPVLVLFGVVGLILLIACANVATLLLARLNERRHELAIRTAIGARQGHILRQVFVESLVLAIEGSILGLIMTEAVLGALLPFVPVEIAPLVDIDGPVLVFVLLISCLTAVLFGLFPALQSCKFSPSQALKHGERSLTRSGHHTFRRLLAVGQIGLALTLVICAGLMLKSGLRLADVGSGFQTEGLVGMGFQGATIRLYREAMTPEGMDFENYAKGLEVYNKELLRRLEAVPGIQGAASVYPLPMSGNTSSHAYQPEGEPVPTGGRYPIASLYSVSPGYFATMGIPLLQGRGFADNDRWGSASVIVNRTLAESCWAGANPIGRALTLPLSFGQARFTVVGVVADTKHGGLNEAPVKQIYMSCYSFPSTGMLAVRSQLPPDALAQLLRREIARFDSEAAIYDVKPMGERLAGSVAYRERLTTLITIFAGIALLLSAVGVFAVMSQGIYERKHEIGVRIAVGASSWQVLGMVLGEAMVLTAFGIALGILGALAVARLLTSWLFGITAHDPMTFVVCSSLIAGAGILAAYRPAYRAARTDPMLALRSE